MTHARLPAPKADITDDQLVGVARKAVR